MAASLAQSPPSLEEFPSPGGNQIVTTSEGQVGGPGPREARPDSWFCLGTTAPLPF